MSCWLLAKNLEKLAKASEDAEFKRLCELVREYYKYPVDSVLITPKLAVVGHKNANDSMLEGARDYVYFLQKGRGLEGAGPPVPPKRDRKAGAGVRGSSVTVTPEKPTASLLDVFRSKGNRRAFSGFYRIDALAFEKGGVITIEAEVGLSKLAGSFELCRMMEVGPTSMALTPVAKAKDVAAGKSKRIVYRFRTGQVFHLGVRGESDKELTNAFSVRVTVK